MILHKRPANINMAFARPLKVLATLGNSFFAGGVRLGFWFVEDKKTEYGIAYRSG